MKPQPFTETGCTAADPFHAITGEGGITNERIH